MRLSRSLSIQGSWLLRAIRGARPDRNALRRRIDRLETCLLVGLFVVLAAVTPFTARLAGRVSYANGLHARQEQLATRHQVPAVLTTNASGFSTYALSAWVLTPATWTSVTGVRRSGLVPAEPESREGTLVTIWTDGNGYLDSPPRAVADIASQADAATTGVIIGAGVVCIIGTAAIRQLFNRRRMAAWEADWLATAPTWNPQR